MPMRSESARWLPWLLAAAGLGFDLVAFWPGQMSFDSAYAWWQARGGETSTIVPPAFVLIWRVCRLVIEGPGALFALHLALFWSGLALLMHALRCGGRAAAAIMTLVAFAPVVLVLRSHVWTDVGLLAALTFATGALAQGHRDARRRWLAPALLALLHAGLLRHNALPAIVPLLAWGAWLALRGRNDPKRVHVAFATVALLAAIIGIGRVLDAHVRQRVPTWPSLAQFDLAAISIESGALRLPGFMHGPTLDLPDLAQAFRPWSNTPMLQGTRGGMRDPFMPPMSPAQLSALRRAWIDAIADEPHAWLAHRWRLTRALFGTHAPDWPRELVFVDATTGYRDNPPIARNGGRLHRNVMQGAAAVVATPLLAAWPLLALGLLATPFAWRCRNALAGRIAAIMLVSAWAYALPLTLLAPAAELRYLGWPCVASLIAFALCLFAPASARAARLPAEPETRNAMSTVQRYMFSIDDLPRARGESHELSFHGGSSESFAALLQTSLREPGLWQRWRSMQPDPEAVDPTLGQSDPAAVVEAHQSDVHVSVEVRSTLPHAIIKHRMTLLIGKHWTLRDVSAA